MFFRAVVIDFSLPAYNHNLVHHANCSVVCKLVNIMFMELDYVIAFPSWQAILKIYKPLQFQKTATSLQPTLLGKGKGRHDYSFVREVE